MKAIMKKVGIMGGTFNPVHYGHLILAENAYEQVGLDEVLFMPTKNPPHKCKAEILSEDHRIKMVMLAIHDNPHFTLSMLEINREGTTYTADTLTFLTKEHADTQYFFIVGADSLFMLEDWKEPQTVFDLSTILVAGRDHVKVDELERQSRYLQETYGARIILLDIPTIEISSNAIRTKIAQSKTVRYYVPEEVIAYITKNNLYDKLPEKSRSIEIQQLRESMRMHLNKKRYCHSVGVEEVSYDLALIYGYDTEKAGIAGILHDCAKYLSEEELIEECKKYHLPISETEGKSAYLLHAKLGAYYANKNYEIQDADILDAITYHTTGRPNMSLLEKIIFTADYIEPNREPIPRIDDIRRAAYENLDFAVLMILENTLNYLKNTGVVIDTLTNETYEYYKRQSMEGDLNGHIKRNG